MAETFRAKRIWCAAALSVAIAVALAIGARAQAGGGLINGCIGPTGGLRVLNPGDTCRPSETAISWNAQGPTGGPGPQGQPGPAGSDGRDGRDGLSGRDGRDCQAPAAQAPTISGQMRVEGVNGIGSADETPIFTLSAGTSTQFSTGGSGGGAGRTNFADFVVTKALDAFSAPLLKASETGDRIDHVTIELFDVNNSNVRFATYTLQDAFITSDVFGTTLTGTSEAVSFTYTRITSRIELNGHVYQSCFDKARGTSC